MFKKAAKKGQGKQGTRNQSVNFVFKKTTIAND